MTESVFISFSDQCALIDVGFHPASPILPFTNGNLQVLKEFLIEEPKSDIRIRHHDQEFIINSIFTEGVRTVFNVTDMYEVKTKLSFDEVFEAGDAEFEVCSVNMFSLFVRQHAGT